MKDCHHLFIFEGVLSRQKFELLVVVGVAPLLLWWSFPKQLDCHGFFPLGLGGLSYVLPFVVDPYLFLSTGNSNFLADFSAISACSTSFFQVLAVTVIVRKACTKSVRFEINSKGHDTAESFDTDTLTVWVSGIKEYQRQYSFKDEHVVTLFHLHNKGNKLKLPEARCPDEVGRTNGPNYYLFHRMVHHPTCRCNVLKDKIQACACFDSEVRTSKGYYLTLILKESMEVVNSTSKSHGS